jgi:hypothetical protein
MVSSVNEKVKDSEFFLIWLSYEDSVLWKWQFCVFWEKWNLLVVKWNIFSVNNIFQQLWLLFLEQIPHERFLLSQISLLFRHTVYTTYVCENKKFQVPNNAK